MKKGKVWRKLTLLTISTDLSWSSFDQDEKNNSIAMSLITIKHTHLTLKNNTI